MEQIVLARLQEVASVDANVRMAAELALKDLHKHDGTPSSHQLYDVEFPAVLAHICAAQEVDPSLRQIIAFNRGLRHLGRVGLALEALRQQAVVLAWRCLCWTRAFRTSTPFPTI
jgi:hypothetical protein